MAYGELVIQGTLESSGVLKGQMYEPIPSSTVEAEKIPPGEDMTILDGSFNVVAVIPEGDYWVRLDPTSTPIHMTVAEFEAQYRPVTP